MCRNACLIRRFLLQSVRVGGGCQDDSGVLFCLWAKGTFRAILHTDAVLLSMLPSLCRTCCYSSQREGASCLG